VATLNQVSTSSGGTWSTSIVGKDTDSTTSSRPTISSTSTITDNPYLVFNCSGVPTGATVTAISAQIKMRAYSTSYTAKVQMFNDTTSISNQVTTTSTSTSNILTVNATSIPSTFTNLRLYFGNSSSSSNRRPYVYGGHITITYTVPTYYITTSKTGSGSIDPEGETTVYGGETFNLLISVLPTSVIDNGIDVTSQITPYTHKLSITANNSSYTGLSSGQDSVAKAIGHTAEEHYSMTSNWYSASGAAVDTGYAQYTFDLSSIPSSATNIQVSCKVYGHAESSTHTYSAGGKYSHWQLYCNGSAKGSYVYTTSTSNTEITITDCGTWTREELNNLQLRNCVGYYGGGTAGITLTISWEGGEYNYKYSITNIAANHTIAVTFGTSTQQLYLKKSGAWVEFTGQVYKKVSGTWVLQTDISHVFDTGTNYVKGDT